MTDPLAPEPEERPNLVPPGRVPPTAVGAGTLPPGGTPPPRGSSQRLAIALRVAVFILPPVLAGVCAAEYLVYSQWPSGVGALVALGAYGAWVWWQQRRRHVELTRPGVVMASLAGALVAEGIGLVVRTDHVLQPDALHYMLIPLGRGVIVGLLMALATAIVWTPLWPAALRRWQLSRLLTR